MVMNHLNSYPGDRFGLMPRSGQRRNGGCSMLNLAYPQILELFREYLDPNRNESASFLIWYLENYYRLDPVEAVDSVCDQKGDKGVDGMFVNDNDETITIFQSQISQKPNTTLGDADLKQFYGTISQFTTPDRITHLIKTAGQTHVGILAKHLDLANRLPPTS